MSRDNDFKHIEMSKGVFKLTLFQYWIEINELLSEFITSYTLIKGKEMHQFARRSAETYNSELLIQYITRLKCFWYLIKPSLKKVNQENVKIINDRLSNLVTTTNIEKIEKLHDAISQLTQEFFDLSTQFGGDYDPTDFEQGRKPKFR